MKATREEIAAALSSVDGITGSAYKPRTAAVGQGWPEWSYTTPETFEADEITWLVHVTLTPGLEEVTSENADRLVDDLVAALAQVGAVERYEPTTLIPQAKGDPTLPCITFTLTTV